jgi:hypothetical protein
MPMMAMNWVLGCDVSRGNGEIVAVGPSSWCARSKHSCCATIGSTIG